MDRDAPDAGGKTHRVPRRRAGAGERLHPRRHPLPGALRVAARLGDAHPQSAGALARQSRAARRCEARRGCHHARGRLRRSLPRRREARPHLRHARSPHLPARGLGRGGQRENRAPPPHRRAPRAHDAPARVPLEPSAEASPQRGADAHPGSRRDEADRGEGGRTRRAPHARAQRRGDGRDRGDRR